MQRANETRDNQDDIAMDIWRESLYHDRTMKWTLDSVWHGVCWYWNITCFHKSTYGSMIFQTAYILPSMIHIATHWFGHNLTENQLSFSVISHDLLRLAQSWFFCLGLYVIGWTPHSVTLPADDGDAAGCISKPYLISTLSETTTNDYPTTFLLS